MAGVERYADRVSEDGFALVPVVFTAGQVDDMLRGLGAALAGEGGPIRSREGSVYAARNVLALWPAAAQVWRQPPLPEVLAALLGPAFGLVRALYFDKPPEQTWALPWHKDVTIAVRDNHLPSAHFGKPTRKAGVPHVEAPVAVLERMLTVRIHLDEVTEENGPLKVVPGSHRSGTAMTLAEGRPQSILAGRGDVLLIRPLVAHCSNRSQPGTCRHRRILHLEFAASPELPDGYTWHTFLPGAG